MITIRLITILLTCYIVSSCGKVGPLALPEEKLNKSIITYPCDDECKKLFEEEKKRQQSVILQTNLSLSN